MDEHGQVLARSFGKSYSNNTPILMTHLQMMHEPSEPYFRMSARRMLMWALIRE